VIIMDLRRRYKNTMFSVGQLYVIAIGIPVFLAGIYVIWSLGL